MTSIIPNHDMSGAPREVNYDLDPLPKRDEEGIPETLVSAIEEAQVHLDNLKALKEILLSPDNTDNSFELIRQIIQTTHRISGDTPRALEDFHIVQAHHHLGRLSTEVATTTVDKPVS